jgi:hypothetical protein
MTWPPEGVAMAVLVFVVTVLWPLSDHRQAPSEAAPVQAFAKMGTDQEGDTSSPGGLRLDADTIGPPRPEVEEPPVGRTLLYGQHPFGSHRSTDTVEFLAAELEGVRKAKAEMERREKELTDQLRQKFEADQRHPDQDRKRLEDLGVLPARRP